MANPHSILCALALTGSLTGSLVGCGYEPEIPVFASVVSAETREALREADVRRPDLAAAQIEGALGLYFGSPSAPGFRVTEDWLEEERDPSDPWWELSGEAVDAVRAGNRVRFAAQLAGIESAGDRPAGDSPTGEGLHLPAPLRGGQSWVRWQRAFEALIVGDVSLTDLHPDSPSVEDASEDDPTFTWGDEATRFWESYYPALAESAELYRVRCLTCHGALGAGDGPTGMYLNPRPRDLRDGIFKWVDVEANRRPRRADLLQVLERGVRGSAMPSFRRYSRGELEGLVDWIRYLAVRGETEQLTVYFTGVDGAVDPARVESAYGTVWERWDAAVDQVGAVPDAVPLPADVTPEMVGRGAELFRGSLANCASCHGGDGEGDGEAIWEVDGAGTRARRLDRWGQPSQPRNLTAGVFFGGDRPRDLYRRIKYGIGGTIMPAADDSLTDADIWSLVYFVLSLSDSNGGPR